MAHTWIWAVIAGVLASRTPHVGLTPILGVLVWASCVLRRRDVATIGLGAMLIHDLIVGVSAFTVVRLAAIGAVLGLLALLRPRPTAGSLAAALLFSAPVYHVALATGDWITQTCSQAPRTLEGLLSTMASAWPYAQRAFLGEVVFTAVFFTAYTLAGYLVTRLPRPAHHP